MEVIMVKHVRFLVIMAIVVTGPLFGTRDEEPIQIESAQVDAEHNQTEHNCDLCHMLPDEILQLIASKFESVQDFENFGLTCRYHGDIFNRLPASLLCCKYILPKLRHMYLQIPGVKFKESTIVWIQQKINEMFEGQVTEKDAQLFAREIIYLRELCKKNKNTLPLLLPGRAEQKIKDLLLLDKELVLSFAMSFNGEFNLERVKALIWRGADFAVRDRNGNTPLHHAVRAGNIDAVIFFLGLGVEVNTELRDGYTPLHTAVRKGFYEIAEMLLEHGACQTKDALGLYPRDMTKDKIMREVLDAYAQKKDVHCDALPVQSVKRLEVYPAETEQGTFWQRMKEFIMVASEIIATGKAE